MSEIIDHFTMCIFACIVVHYLLHFIHDHNNEGLEADIERLTIKKSNSKNTWIGPG